MHENVDIILSTYAKRFWDNLMKMKLIVNNSTNINI